jgi:hypothetical protein
VQEGLPRDVGPQHVGVAHLHDNDLKLAQALGAVLGGTGLIDSHHCQHSNRHLTKCEALQNVKHFKM